MPHADFVERPSQVELDSIWERSLPRYLSWNGSSKSIGSVVSQTTPLPSAALDVLHMLEMQYIQSGKSGGLETSLSVLFKQSSLLMNYQ